MLLLLSIGWLSITGCGRSTKLAGEVIALTRSPHPTFTPSPTTTPSPSPTTIPTALPKATPTGTPTPFTPIPPPTAKYPPPTPSLALSYPEAAYRETQTIVTASERLYQLLQSAEVTDPNWVHRAMINKHFIYTSYAMLRFQIPVPADMVEFHDKLLTGLQKCVAIENQVGDPRYPLKAGTLEEIAQLLKHCQEETQIVQEI